MTEKEIMDRLGLKPWAEQAIESARRLLSDEMVDQIGQTAAYKSVIGGRGSGRTERMIVQAVEVLSQGHTCKLVGRNSADIERVRKLVEDYCSICGIRVIRLPPSLCEVFPSITFAPVTKSLVFHDHNSAARTVTETEGPRPYWDDEK